MNEKQYEKWSLWGGIVFVVLVLVAGFIAGEPPEPTDSAQKISKYFTDNLDELKIGSFLNGVAILPFLWFLGALFGRFRAAEGGAGRGSGIALTGGVVAVGLATMGNAFLAFGALYPESSVGSYQLSTVLYGFGGFAVATLTGAASAVILRSKLLPSWIGYLGCLNSILWIVGSAVVSSKKDAFYYTQFAAWLVWLLWIVVLVVFFTRKQEATA